MFSPSPLHVAWWLCLAAVAMAACAPDEGSDPGKEASGLPGTPAVPVAQIAMDGGGLSIRNAGKGDFMPWDRKSRIGQGATLRSGDGIVSLNFLGCVEVQLSQKSELILEGAVDTSTGPVIVLALKNGEVRVNSSADCPVCLKTPPGEVMGVRSFFTANVRHTRDEGYSATIKALSPNIRVRNDYGSLDLESWGWVKLEEASPPRVLKNLKQPHRKR